MRVGPLSTHVPPSLARAPVLPAPRRSLLNWWVALASRLRGAAPAAGPELSARIRRYDVFEQPREWSRCREAGWYHQSRARRALDREDWRGAERQARKALEWDDTRAANFLVLGEALARRQPPDRAAARLALERALALDPRNSYIIDRLLALYRAERDLEAARRLLRDALAAGAPRQVWGPELERLEAASSLPLAS